MRFCKKNYEIELYKLMSMLNIKNFLKFVLTMTVSPLAYRNLRKKSPSSYEHVCRDIQDHLSVTLGKTEIGRHNLHL